MKYLLTFIGLISCWSCNENHSVITIIDIAYLDRIGLAKQLSIVKKYEPKVVGLNYLLTTDSLDKDALLVKELAESKKIILSAMLHEYIEHYDYWDSLEQYHKKFQSENFGFSNITITDDSVFVPELPMRQRFKGRTIHALSYLIAANSFGVKPYYNQNGTNDFIFDRNSFGKNYKVISAKDLLSERFDKCDIKDKIVLIGHISDKADSFYINRKRTKRISGTEIHASIIQQLIE